jgi:hypothetical protein
MNMVKIVSRAPSLLVSNNYTIGSGENPEITLSYNKNRGREGGGKWGQGNRKARNTRTRQRIGAPSMPDADPDADRPYFTDDAALANFLLDHGVKLQKPLTPALCRAVGWWRFRDCRACRYAAFYRMPMWERDYYRNQARKTMDTARRGEPVVQPLVSLDTLYDALEGRASWEEDDSPWREPWGLPQSDAANDGTSTGAGHLAVLEAEGITEAQAAENARTPSDSIAVMIGGGSLGEWTLRAAHNRLVPSDVDFAVTKRVYAWLERLLEGTATPEEALAGASLFCP